MELTFFSGLAYLRLAGFVHRDISPGNCLIYEGQMKISDLEYARKYISQGKNITPLTVCQVLLKVKNHC